MKIFFILITLILGMILARSPIDKTLMMSNVQEKVQGMNSIYEPDPLTIEYLRKSKYPGSNFVIEEELTPGRSYNQYIVSYLSDGIKIHALLTVPKGTKPEKGWPAIVVNHGDIPPREYKTVEKYVPHVRSFASNGYVVLKPDFRGHGESEGTAVNAYAVPDYTIDVLNSIASLR